MSDRLPFDRNAERAVVGAAVHGAAWYAKAASIVSPSDFYSERERLVFTAVGEISGPVDVLILSEYLDRKGLLERAGGRSFISELMDSVPDFGGVTKYARMVERCSRRRRAKLIARQVEASADGGGDDFEDVIEKASLSLAVETNMGDRGAQDAREFARLAAKRIESRYSRGEWIIGLKTGIDEMDALTLGIPRGVLSILGARPMVGKTGAMLNIAVNVVEAGGSVVLYQMDMSEEMVSDRVISLLSGATTFEVRSGRMPEGTWQRVAEATSRFASWGSRFRVNYRARSISQISAEVRRFSQSEQISLVAIDHVGHVTGGEGESRYLRVGDVSSKLKDLATSTGIPVLALSQLRRDAADTRAPELSDLRESGNLEQDARLVILLDAPHWRRQEIAKCRLDVIVAKNSEGSAGDAKQVHFDLETQRIGSPEAECRLCSSRQREVA